MVDMSNSDRHFNHPPEQPPLHQQLRNGDIISQREFTRLILEQERVDSLTLLTMAYMDPSGGEGSVWKIHSHLLELADRGGSIHIGVDNTYANFFAPHTDIPRVIAPLFVDRNELKNECARLAHMYKELIAHPNIEFAFNGPRCFATYFDHRKILCIKGPNIRNFALIYGFNVDKTLDHEVDSAVFMTDPEVINWIDQQQLKKSCPQPEKATINDFSFITREVGWQGARLAKQEIYGLIQQAEDHLLFCSQFLPDGSLLDNLIHAASQGVRVDVVSNKPNSSRQPMYLLKRRFVAERFLQACQTNKNLSFYAPENQDSFVHIKALITDIDKPKISRALTGTDNMANPFRTREILVELRRYEHIHGFQQYIERNVLPYLERIA